MAAVGAKLLCRTATPQGHPPDLKKVAGGWLVTDAGALLQA